MSEVGGDTDNESSQNLSMSNNVILEQEIMLGLNNLNQTIMQRENVQGYFLKIKISVHFQKNMSAIIVNDFFYV